MCIFVLAIMAILLFYLSASIEQYQLIELINDINIPVSKSWDVILTLWPAMGFMFFLGVFSVLIILKLWNRSEPKIQQ